MIPSAGNSHQKNSSLAPRKNKKVLQGSDRFSNLKEELVRSLNKKTTEDMLEGHSKDLLSALAAKRLFFSFLTWSI